MLKSITSIDGKTGEPIVRKHSALSTFCYESGYTFLGEDLGNRGVKIELVHKYEDGKAIILPPRKAKECGRWLLKTIGEEGRKLPKELPDILERLVEQKGLKQKLKRGDKKTIKKALRVLRTNPSHN